MGRRKNGCYDIYLFVKVPTVIHCADKCLQVKQLTSYYNLISSVALPLYISSFYIYFKPVVAKTVKGKYKYTKQ